MKILAPQRKPPHRLEETQQKTNFPPFISSWERKGKSDEAVLTRETHRRRFSPKCNYLRKLHARGSGCCAQAIDSSLCQTYPEIDHFAH